MKPKVIHIQHESRGGGGMTLALEYFPRYLPHFETHAITGNLGPLPDRLWERGVTVHPLPLDRLGSALCSIPRIVSILRRERPDVVILHGQWGSFCGAVASWLAGIKRVIYYTQMPCFYTDWDFYRIARNRFVEKVCCSVATRVVSLSEAGRYQYLLRQLAPEEKLLHIPNGIDLAKLYLVADKTELRRQLGLPMDQPVVVSVGRLDDQKHVDWLVRAWPQVEAAIPTASLFIVGEGSEREGLERLARAEGVKNLHFVGRQPEAYRYFQAADLGVITSLFEGMPFSLLEGMACGCVMVGMAADGIAETIVNGETGFCVPVADVSALAEKIIYALSKEKQLEPMRQEARQRVEERYAMELVMAQQIGLVEELLNLDARL